MNSTPQAAPEPKIPASEEKTSVTYDIENPLATLHKEHPRLLANAADFERLSKTTHDPLHNEIVKRVLVAAEEALNAPVVEHKLSGTGNYRYMLGEARAALQRITVSAAAYRLSKDIRFAERAKKEMLTAASFEDWNPAHFLDVGELCMALALGYDWIYDTLTPEERLTIKTALKEKGLELVPVIYGKPYTDAKEIPDKRLWWTVNPYNWNQVCHAGLLAAALIVAEDDPETAKLVIQGVRRYLPIAMHCYAPDGAWPEGPVYWGYGTTFNVLAIAMLESALGTDFGLSTVEPVFSKTALFRMHMTAPNTTLYNYADASADREKDISPAFGWLAKRFNSPAESAFFRQLLAQQFAERPANKEKDRFFSFHLFWLPAELKEIPPAPLDVHYKGEADVAVFRSAWYNPDALFFGFKAGKNGINHAHLDLGSFILDADGVRWSVELGPDNYNLPAYFGANRWNYYRLINFGHSTITPGDLLQDAKATAPIISYKSTPELAGAVADLTPAYPGISQKFLRGAFLLDRSRVLIQDDITALAANTPLNWRMITKAQIEISPDGKNATLTQNGKTLRAEILSPANAAFSIASAKPPTAAESQNAGMSILLATIPAAAKEEDVRVAVALSPVGPNWPANLPKPSPLNLSTP